MSNYTKLTDFATKDTLPSGNSAKIVRGTEIDDEFNSIESNMATKADLTLVATKADLTLVATKANIASPTFTGTVTIPTLDGSSINGGSF